MNIPDLHYEESTLGGRRHNLYKMNKQYYVYILTNSINSVLYTGVTSDLIRRIYEHKEKQIKNYSRRKKFQLVESMNSEWRDLVDDL